MQVKELAEHLNIWVFSVERPSESKRIPEWWLFRFHVSSFDEDLIILWSILNFNNIVVCHHWCYFFRVMLCFFLYVDGSIFIIHNQPDCPICHVEMSGYVYIIDIVYTCLFSWPGFAFSLEVFTPKFCGSEAFTTAPTNCSFFLGHTYAWDQLGTLSILGSVVCSECNVEHFLCILWNVLPTWLSVFWHSFWFLPLYATRRLSILSSLTFLPCWETPMWDHQGCLLFALQSIGISWLITINHTLPVFCAVWCGSYDK